MKKQTVIAIVLFFLFSTINPSQKIIISKFNIKKIQIENNFLLRENEIKELLVNIYDENLLFLNNSKIEKLLMVNSFIESFDIKKKYPNSLKIRIFEKKPIVILINKKDKFYLSDKIDLIKFKELQNYKDLPYVFGNKEEFKIIYNNLRKVNFPFNIIKKYTLYESKRWDLETINEKLIKLPQKNYMESLKNYLSLKDKKNFKKYQIFDYRIKNQLILK